MNLVVIGAQWGDEGKGKIVDWLAGRAQIVVRYSGGANAGHTIVRGGTTFKLHLVPSGITHPGTLVVLGVGMVIDPQALFEELAGLERAGIAWQGRVKVADRAHLVLPRYRELDKAQEQARARPLGTTGRGIGVAYSLKAARDGLRVADAIDAEFLATLPAEDRAFLEPLVPRLAELAVDASLLLDRHRGSEILFEGAQGALLDIDHGTYPYVSSGSSCAGGAAVGGAVGPTAVGGTVGVCKAYATRVGSGPFPSEFKAGQAAEGDRLRDLGREYGTTTGRPRRCGWIDLVALRYACRTNSVGSLAITKLDVLSDFEQIGVCTGYRVGGAVVAEFPASRSALEAALPVVEYLPGWREPIGQARRWEELPARAREYLQFIERAAATPISLVSVGPERGETIVRKDPWTGS
jgi:adenylosuccinate synthase